MTKIELPWRRFGDERPDYKQKVLVWENRDLTPYAASYLLKYWEPRDSNTKWRAGLDDRWIYLSEIETPFEEGKE